VRLGLMGGTFDPIHLGHLRGAEAAREMFNLEEIFFIPAALPPHKNNRPVMPQNARWEMVRLAIEGNPAFVASDVELAREGKSYSIETILYFRNLCPGADLFFIEGLDSFLEVTTWKRYQDLFSLCHFVVLNRPGSTRPQPEDLCPSEFWTSFRVSKDPNQWIHSSSGFSIYFMDRPVTDISSSEIRERIRAGKSVRYMMQERVEAYVLQNLFYSQPQMGKTSS
jgi:nicotinate-nucleotide adenylyltransferase